MFEDIIFELEAIREYADTQDISEWEYNGRTKAELSRYYSDIQDSLHSVPEKDFDKAMYWRMVGLYKDIFVTYAADEKDYAIYQTACGVCTYIYSPLKDSWDVFCGDIPDHAVPLPRLKAEQLEDSWREIIHRPEFDCCDSILNALEILHDSSDYYAGLGLLLSRMSAHAHAGGYMLTPSGVIDANYRAICGSPLICHSRRGGPLLPVYPGYSSAPKTIWNTLQPLPIAALINTVVNSDFLRGMLLDPDDSSFCIDRDFLIPFAR